MTLIPPSTLLTVLKATAAVRVSSGSCTFWAHFDDEYTSSELAAAPIDSSLPRLLARSCDVAHLRTDDPVTKDDEAYRIVSVQPDGTGMTTLILGRA